MASIHIPPSWKIPEQAATTEQVYWNRRQILRQLGLGSLALSLAPQLTAAPDLATKDETPEAAGATKPAVGARFSDLFPARKNMNFDLGERTLTPEVTAATNNNFYEFTIAKERVWELARDYQVDSWNVKVGGLVKKPGTFDLEKIFTRFPLEERLYRFRCVERWAMQVPWTGYPLRLLIDALEPLPSARYVRFISLSDEKGFPGQRKQPWYPWPYYEGLRLDEARHDLAFVAVGIYGHALPMQHGGPWRLAVPWKYGYKSPKSIVAIEFTKKKPSTFWHDYQPREYGFFSNCEPHKPHPRWSQEWEQDIGTGKTRRTLLYNGYADAVESLYNGKEV